MENLNNKSFKELVEILENLGATICFSEEAYSKEELIELILGWE